MFVAFMIYKSELVNSLSSGTEIRWMYERVKIVEHSIFSPQLCHEKYQVQDCSDNEKDGIFDHSVPDDIYFDVAGWMEKKFSCNGFSDVILKKFCFSDVTKYGAVGKL